MPSASGPALCAQRFSRANISSSMVRNTAMRPAGVVTQRAPRRGMLETRPISIQSVMALLRRRREAEFGHRRELVRVLAVDPLFPQVDLREFLGVNEAVVVAAALVEVGDDIGLDRVDADSFGPFVDALEVAPLLAIELHQRRDNLERLILRIGMTQELGALDVEARGTGEVYVVAGIDADHADVLAGGLRAIARAARNRHLDLGRRPASP